MGKKRKEKNACFTSRMYTGLSFKMSKIAWLILCINMKCELLLHKYTKLQVFLIFKKIFLTLFIRRPKGTLDATTA